LTDSLKIFQVCVTSLDKPKYSIIRGRPIRLLKTVHIACKWQRLKWKRIPPFVRKNYYFVRIIKFHLHRGTQCL